MRKIYFKLNKNYNIKNNYKNKNINSIFVKTLLKEFITIPTLAMHFGKLSYKQSNEYSKFRMRCLLSNRVRGTLKKFMLSRMILKKLALNGYIVGMKKASW